MNRNTVENAQGGEQLGELILEFVDAFEAGRKFNRDDFIRAHAQFRPELEAFFAGHDKVERVAAPLRTVSADNSHKSDLIRNPGRRWPIGVEPGTATRTIGQLGEFRLLREVGRGGMGVVYEAEQMSLQRRVALKVLPFAAAIDDRRLQRFRNEAMAAAHLRHENIVPVYAVGADLGVHYYAMQFIEGQSLAVLIEELRRVAGVTKLPHHLSQPGSVSETARAHFAGTPETRAIDSSTTATISRNLCSGSRRYFEWVAGLGRQTAEALEHSHQMGIVHRDIKPANLLLDPRGQVWVTDFGLAQLSGDAGLTVTGELLGTLRYASPEQTGVRRGLVDHRTDIYSLGATLYELLTLRPLFEGSNRNELLRQIADHEPHSPRSIRPSVPEELETVVLKALAKESSDRYATAHEMAADLQRFLENRPILARRPTASERLRKWARRHPSIVVACGTVLLFLSAASLISTVLIHGEQRKAKDAYQRERQRADEAEAQFLLARRSVDELFRVSEQDLAYSPGAEPLRRRLLTSVLSYYQEFIDRRRDDPDAQAVLMETRQRVEQILDDLGALRAAWQLNLLSQLPVLDDLQLDEGQRAKVRELSIRPANQWTDLLRDVGRVSAAERGRRSLELARTNAADLKAVLTAKQLHRLHQIGLQADVASAFREPEVAAALNLTDEQRDSIRTIEEAGFFDMMKSIRPDLFPANDETVPEQQSKPSTNDRILKLLTKGQLEKWREITGLPIEGTIRFPSPFDFASPEPEGKAPAR